MSNPKQLHRINGIDVIHYLFSYEISHLVLAFFRCNVKCGVHILGGGINLCTMLQQKHYDINVAQARCNVQSCLLFASSCIDLSPVSQQNSNNIGLKMETYKITHKLSKLLCHFDEEEKSDAPYLISSTSQM